MTAVYFLRRNGLVKVGQSRCVEKRIKNLMGGVGTEGAHAIGVIPTKASRLRHVERQWVKRLQPWLAFGHEWFHDVEPVMAAILAEAQPPPTLTDPLATDLQISLVAAKMARDRWRKVSKADRTAHAHKMVAARQWRKVKREHLA